MNWLKLPMACTKLIQFIKVTSNEKGPDIIFSTDRCKRL